MRRLLLPFAQVRFRWCSITATARAILAERAATQKSEQARLRFENRNARHERLEAEKKRSVKPAPKRRPG